MKKKELVGERRYYTEISTWLKQYVASTLREFGAYIVDTEVCDLIGLSEGIRRLLKRNKIKSNELQRKIDLTRELMVDVILLVYDRSSLNSEIIICEVKEKRALSLQDCSQLAGYCICADVSFGLLINVDAGISDALRETLGQNAALTHLVQIINQNKRTRMMGILTWESKTRRGLFLPNGYLKSLKALCKEIVDTLKL
jgi:hypothetical protein